MRLKSCVKILLAICVITSCTFTERKPTNPDFQVDINIIKSALSSILICNDIEIFGFETKTNGKKTQSQLVAKFVNASFLSNNETEQNEVANTLAKKIKSYLKNGNQFITFEIAFIKKRVSGYITETSGKSYFFASDQL